MTHSKKKHRLCLDGASMIPILTYLVGPCFKHCDKLLKTFFSASSPALVDSVSIPAMRKTARVNLTYDLVPNIGSIPLG